MPEQLNVAKTGTYVSEKLWSDVRPKILVICCSDGCYQEAIDEFLNAHLGTYDYDRVFA